MLWLLLLTQVVLIDQSTTVPPAQWRWVELNVPDFPSELDCAYTVTSRGAGVRALLMTLRDAQLMRDRNAFRIIQSTPIARSGGFIARLDEADRYVIVVDNRADLRFQAQLALRVRARPAESVVEPGYVPQKRRAVVVFLSLLFLTVTAAYSLPRVWRALHKDADYDRQLDL